MRRVIIHADRRSGRAGAFVIVIDGITCASGNRESMIDVLNITDELETVTCVHCGAQKESA